MRAIASCAVAFLLAACQASQPDYTETDIADLHDHMQRGDLSSETLVNWYLGRIESIDSNGPALNSMIEVNPDALSTARALDREWKASGPRGPLHGVPVVLKANIDTADGMATSAGSLALAEHIAAQDAFVVQQLRDAGAVILGKANLSEWANFRSTKSSSGWSSIGGQTLNPYDVSRSPCGSSSGSAVAVAANLTAVAVGTETDGSVVCPAGANGIVGIKPTLGLVSRSGIIPIAESQDTAGPMGRTVRDAAILLTAMTGIDSDDLATSNAVIHRDYSANLTADAMRDKRIGIIRSWQGQNNNNDVAAIYEASIATMKDAGAIVIDDLTVDSGEMGDAEYEVLLYEFRDGLNRYLENSRAPVTSLADVIHFNVENSDRVMPIFDQDIFLAAEAKGPLTEQQYLDAKHASRQTARNIIDTLMDEHELDALIAPTNGPAWKIDHVNGDDFSVGSSSLAAVSGYPNITVPAGFVEGLPVGVSFMGRAWNEKQLIEIAYAFEQNTKIRRPPQL